MSTKYKATTTYQAYFITRSLGLVDNRYLMVLIMADRAVNSK
ncbi:MAG: hypothetical protein ABI554_14480 [Flavobacterium sp.]